MKTLTYSGDLPEVTIQCPFTAATWTVKRGETVEVPDPIAASLAHREDFGGKPALNLAPNPGSATARSADPSSADVEVAASPQGKGAS